MGSNTHDRTTVLFIHGAGQGAYEEDGLLVASLREALGPGWAVRYPRMVNEASPDYEAWKAQIARELESLEGEVVLMGHSFGGSTLLKYLCEERVEKPIAAVVGLAAPFWGADADWDWDAGRLPEDAAARLAGIPRILLYHCRDDEIVPFRHLAHYAASLPRAIVHEIEAGGHQFANDLADVAKDIAVGE